MVTVYADNPRDWVLFCTLLRLVYTGEEGIRIQGSVKAAVLFIPPGASSI